MTETITDGPGPRHVFVPHPDPVEGMPHRIYVLYEESDGRLWASGTDMMTPSLESAGGVLAPAQRDTRRRQGCLVGPCERRLRSS